MDVSLVDHACVMVGSEPVTQSRMLSNENSAALLMASQPGDHPLRVLQSWGVN